MRYRLYVIRYTGWQIQGGGPGELASYFSTESAAGELASYFSGPVPPPPWGVPRKVPEKIGARSAPRKIFGVFCVILKGKSVKMRKIRRAKRAEKIFWGIFAIFWDLPRESG